jgi:glycosyltransferase involved in cell wall biosynthesis
MKCWLASFPRSGNTYFRNILYYVYGVESSTWHKESRYPVDKNYDQFDFVKTHLLPHDIEPNDKTIPAIYLVRDGRDALVSIAHHRSDIVKPGSDFSDNLFEAIIANNGSYFGGWSKNVTEWLNRADIVIRFEDLIKDPESVFKRVEALIDLPPGNWDRLPDFKKLKFGRPKYGGQTTSKEINIPDGEFSKKFFRKGKSGSWKDDMSSEHMELFWHFHADIMDRLGYPGSPSGIIQNKTLDLMAMQKLGLPDETIHHNVNQRKTSRVLIDGYILSSIDSHSVKRNFIYFLSGLNDVSVTGDTNFIFDVLLDGRFIPLQQLENHIQTERKAPKNLKRFTITLKYMLSSLLSERLYFGLARIFRNAARIKKVNAGTGNILHRRVKPSNDNAFLNLNREMEKYDCYHIPFLGGQQNTSRLPVKTVVTIHSLQPISNRVDLNRHADLVITHSPVISASLQKSLNINKDSVFVIPQSAVKETFYKSNRQSRVDRTLKKYSIFNTEYFVCESYHQDSEEMFISILKGFLQFKKDTRSSGVKLLILDSKRPVADFVPSLVRKSKDIQFSGRIEETDLKNLYSGALAFFQHRQDIHAAFSSREAQLCKVPVIHCSEAPEDELLAFGFLKKACDSEEISESMRLLHSDKKLRNELAEKSYKSTLHMSLRKTISETLSVYKQIAIQ